MAIQGLLFDFDGLLVDTETPSRLVWEELYREHGHELPQDQWATLVGTIGAPFDPFDHLDCHAVSLPEWRFSAST